ncbi:MAG TPA: LapA family protein [Candidatus Methylomirabilis sp.]|nr:LapA family protein [Candidatus Methylomirabilis sp.]
MVQFYLFVALILALLVATFAVQNATPVTVKFLVWNFDSSLVVVILLAAGVGACASALVSLPQTIRAWSRLRQQEAEVARLAGQVRRLEDRVAAQAETAREWPTEEDHAPV